MRVGVYTERHFSSPIAFDILSSDKDLKATIFPLFKEDGTPQLKTALLLPTAFLCSAFKIHDILIQLDTEKKVKHEDYIYFRGYIKYLQRFARFLQPSQALYLWINELNLHGHIEKNEKLSKSMYPVLEIRMDERLNLQFKPLRQPILSEESDREYREGRFRVN